jgi:hypothetical protein
MKLPAAPAHILRQIAQGSTLKSHRTMDSQKVYRLHPLRGPAELVDRPAVEQLKKLGLIHSNQKFPAATYLLTDRGKQVAASLTDAAVAPLAARNFNA